MCAGTEASLTTTGCTSEQWVCADRGYYECTCSWWNGTYCMVIDIAISM